MRRIIFITIALAVLTAAVIFVDFTTLWEALSGLSTTTLTLLFILLSIGAVLKAVRWAFYLRAAKLDISWHDGMTSYLAGMSAGALPGGSVVPARLAQEHGDVRMRQAASALFVSFVGDMIALSLLAAITVAILDQPSNRFIIPAVGLVFASVLVTMGRSGRVWHAVDRLLMRWRLTRSWLPKEADIHQKVSAVMRAPVIARGVALSAGITAVSIVKLYLLVNVLTFTGLSLLEAWYVHSFSEAAAMVIPSPGGIGVVDSSMAGLLNSLSIGWMRATFVVLAIRSSDLLYKTVVGSIFLVVFYHRLLLSILQLRRRARKAHRHARLAWHFGRRMAAGRVAHVRAAGGTRAVRLHRPPAPVPRSHAAPAGAESTGTVGRAARAVHPPSTGGAAD